MAGFSASSDSSIELFCWMTSVCHNSLRGARVPTPPPPLLRLPCCRVQFDRQELGVELVRDTDVMPAEPAENLPPALLRGRLLLNGRQVINGQPVRPFAPRLPLPTPGLPHVLAAAAAAAATPLTAVPAVLPPGSAPPDSAGGAAAAGAAGAAGQQQAGQQQQQSQAKAADAKALAEVRGAKLLQARLAVLII